MIPRKPPAKLVHGCAKARHSKVKEYACGLHGYGGMYLQNILKMRMKN